MKTLNVDLGDRSYPIVIGSGLLADAAGLEGILAQHLRGRQVAVITNPTVAALYGDALLAGLKGYAVDVFEMSDGESHKNMNTYEAAVDFLMDRRHNRTTCLIALGGGVVGDLCGFVAATFQRGVDFIQIPTTLLAQVDSSVGGKTAINHAKGKNMIGAFYQPRCVVADTATLGTLADREYAAGLAEVVKYGVIVDAGFFEWLEKNVAALKARDQGALAHAVERSCAIKAEVVRQDERETGIRAILNYGHTFGHAIEALSGYGSYLHGEAVAIGMVMASDLSMRLGMLDEVSVERVKRLLDELDLPTVLARPIPSAQMLEAMSMDKKVVDGSLRFVLARGIGDVEVVDGVASATIDRTLTAVAANR